jgi:hypothetical protein
MASGRAADDRASGSAPSSSLANRRVTRTKNKRNHRKDSDDYEEKMFSHKCTFVDESNLASQRRLHNKLKKI